MSRFTLEPRGPFTLAGIFPTPHALLGWRPFRTWVSVLVRSSA